MTSGKAGGLKTVNRSKQSALRAAILPNLPSLTLLPRLAAGTPPGVVCGRSPTGRRHKDGRDPLLSRGVGDHAHTIFAPIISDLYSHPLRSPMDSRNRQTL